MIRTDKLRGIIAEKGVLIKDLSQEMGITPKTFNEKMKKGVFGSDEIEIMINKLDIENPMDIFFAHE